MNLTIPMLISALKAGWFLIPIFILIVMVKTPWFKGWIGEAMVDKIALGRLTPSFKTGREQVIG